MGLLLLFDATGNAVMWLALFGAVGLAVWEVREAKFSAKASLWWVLLVMLFHVPGYIALRIVVAYLRRRRAA
jgi:hypothetical protein